MSSENPRTRAELLRELELENRKSTVSGIAFFQAVAERSGMNATDLQGVALLTAKGPLTAGQLAEAMGLTTGAVTGVINRLERSGYVRRTPDPTDGRRVIVTTDLEALERAGAGFFSAEAELMSTLLAPYSDADLAVLLDFTRRANTVTEAEVARIRSATAGGEQAASASLGSVTRGRLVFASGVYGLTLRTAEMTELFQARFEGSAPKVEVEGGTVTLRRPQRFSLFNLRKHAEAVTLNAAVPWDVEVRGGAAQIEADLGKLVLSSFTLKGGIGNVTLTLPKPSGVVPIRLSGGMNHATFHRPAGVEARISVRGGFSTLSFGEQGLHGGGGRVQLQSPGYSEAADRFEIDISGGANTITVR